MNSHNAVAGGSASDHCTTRFKNPKMAEDASQPKGPQYEVKGLVADLISATLTGIGSGAGAAWANAELNQGQTLKDRDKK